MRNLKVVSFDPSTSNWGICKANIDLFTSEVSIDDLILVHTESEKLKGVRKDSDDIRRAKEVRHGMMEACKGAAIAISEIPFMNPGGYPAANYNTGLVVGVLSSCPIPLIQVFPKDVKLASVGVKNAAKEEIIEWAMNKFPAAPWKMRKLRGNMVPTKDNEHLADAVAAIFAAMETAQFQQMVSMYNSMKEAA